MAKQPLYNEAQEQERLRILQDFDILDTPPEEEFDEIVKAAVALCGTPMAAISLVDDHRQWFKARVGLSVSETAKDISICQHTVAEGQPVYIPNTLLDERSKDSPLIQGPPNLRFYCGVPLKVDEEHSLGALCVLDTEPRELTEVQRQVLTSLGRQVVAQIRLRRELKAKVSALVNAEKVKNRIQSFYDSSDFLMGIVELKNDQIELISGNQKTLQLLGTDQSSFSKLNLQDYIPGIGVFEHLKSILKASILAGEPISFTYFWGLQQEQSPSSTRFLLTHLNYIGLGENACPQFSFIANDISEAREHHLQIIENQNFLTSIVDNLPVALMVKSVQEDYKYSLWNKTAERIFGIKSENVLNKTDYDIASEDSADTTRVKDIELIASGTKVHAPEELVHLPNHRSMWVRTTKVPILDHQGHGKYLIAISEDITDRKVRDEIIHEEKEKLEVITQNIGDIVWMSDPRKSKINYISPAYEKIWERSCDSLYRSPQSFLESIHPEDRPEIEKAMMLQSEGRYDQKYRIITPSGQIKWVRDRAFPVRNSEGHVYRIVGVVTDITRAVEQDTLIEEQKAKMASNARLSSLGEMAGGIAHEINNPLTIIQVKAVQMSEAIKKKKIDEAKILEGLDKITKTTGRIARIIRGLKLISRSGEKDPYQDWPLANILEDTLELCREKFRNSEVQLKINIDEAIHLECRAVQISQVLLNLLNNAYDAVQGQSGAWVEVSTQVKYSHQGRPEERIEIIVTDSGGGIPVSIAEKMMNPFFTTKDIGHGTGLGLSISLGIIRDHGGELNYDSSSPNTRFVISLPRRIASASSMAA